MRLSFSKNQGLAVLFSFVCLFFVSKAHALFVSPPKDPMPIIKQFFPSATHIGEKQGEPLVWTIKENDNIIGYAFETNDFAKIPAYSGEPVNMVVGIDIEGKYIGARVIEHHEPIILAGIPESKLDNFTTQYKDLSVNDRLKVGGNQQGDMLHIDGLSGATVTVMVMNVAITKSATKVARALGIISASDDIIQPMSTIYPDVFKQANWVTLTGSGAIRKLYLNREHIDDAFMGT